MVRKSSHSFSIIERKVISVFSEEVKNNMVITDIKVRKLFHDESPMKAVVSVTFDNQLAVHDIKVISAREKLFIVMPSRRNPDGTYRDIVHPINAEFRRYLEDSVLDAYKAALENEENADDIEDSADDAEIAE